MWMFQGPRPGMLRLGAAFGALALLAVAGGLSTADPSTASEPLCAPRQSSYSSAIASTPGLVGYWRLGESTGTTACDYTGRNNGKYLGAITLGVAGAIAEDPDTAVAADGSTGQVSVPSATSLNVGDSFTIEAWVKRGRSKTSSNEVIASKQTGSWVLMFGESDRLTLRRSSVGNVASATVATTDTSSWHYVVATKNGSSVHLYVDGIDVTGTVTNQTMTNNSEPLAIGQSTGTAFLKGSIDEVALYNAPLTASQVSQHYKAGLPSAPPPPPPPSCSPRQSTYSGVVSSTPGLLGYWRLGESAGTTACDYTGKDNGTYLGGVTLAVPGAIAQDPDTAIALNGSTGRVSVPASSTLNVGDSFTIEAWVKRASTKTGANEVIASKQEGAWVLMFNGSDRLTLRRSGVGDVASATVSTTDTTAWHYIAATKSGGSVHLYIDGVDVTGAITNQTMTNNSQPLAIGESLETSYLKGSVDELAIYNAPLTQTQVGQHYKAGLDQSKDPVLAATGDIACAPGDTTHECQQSATAKLVAAWHPSAVAVLGDNQYESGLLSEFDGAGAYNATWGQFNPIVHPTTGNHEYAASASANGYFSYFGSAAPGSYYSYNLGAWHIVALNSNCSDSGCQDALAGTVSSAEVSWLQADLAAHPNQCTLAYWHHPAFSSGWVGNSPGVKPLWNVLYAAHADVVLGGHDHMYERFAQQDPSQNATTQGIREFVVGTGGESLFTMGAVQPNMQAVDNNHFGALFLTLHSSSYEWAFRATNGTVIDSGSTACHAQPSGTPTAGASGTSTSTASEALTSPSSPSSAATGTSPSTMSSSAQSPTAGPLTQAVREATLLSVAARKGTPPLAFSARVQRTTPNALARHGLLVRVRCSRACDVAIAVRARMRAHWRTIARFRKTEIEIPRPNSRLALHLSRRALHALRRAHGAVTFTATDASGQRRTIVRGLFLS